MEKDLNFKPICMPVAIGSLPHTDPVEAFKVAQKYSPECLFWPQLPARDFKENMIVQFTEKMPALKLDEVAERVYFEKGENILEELTVCFEKVIDDDYDYFRISESYAGGFYAMERAAKTGLSIAPKMIKGQVTGPITFGLTVTDTQKKPIIYDPELAEAIVKCIGMKGRWQSKRFEELFPSALRTVFLDEPYLTQIGSAYIGIQPAEALGYLNDCFEAIDGLTGIHVCGKTDWSLIMKSKVDIIHFDAFDHAEAITLYPEDLEDFFSRGGYLVWGVVPTDKNVVSMEGVSLDIILEKLEKSLIDLEKLGFERERVLERSFVSPSCGTGSMRINDADKAFALTYDLSELLRERYFLTTEAPGLQST